MIVEIEFIKLKSVCKYYAKLICNNDTTITEDICIEYPDSLARCDEFSCPYCDLKDEDDGK